MIYCSWSYDDYQSDIDCYAEARGYWAHVADTRIVFKKPLPPPAPEGDTPAWIDRHGLVGKMLRSAEKVRIGLPYDGHAFTAGSPGEMADILVMLKETGYNVPDISIARLREEEEK